MPSKHPHEQQRVSGQRLRIELEISTTRFRDRACAALEFPSGRPDSVSWLRASEASTRSRPAARRMTKLARLAPRIRPSSIRNTAAASLHGPQTMPLMRIAGHLEDVGLRAGAVASRPRPRKRLAARAPEVQHSMHAAESTRRFITWSSGCVARTGRASEDGSGAFLPRRDRFRRSTPGWRPSAARALDARQRAALQ